MVSLDWPHRSPLTCQRCPAFPPLVYFSLRRKATPQAAVIGEQAQRWQKGSPAKRLAGHFKRCSSSFKFEAQESESLPRRRASYYRAVHPSMLHEVLRVNTQSPKGDELVAGLHRSSAYRCRRAALASASVTSGATDNCPVVIQSCRMTSARKLIFLAPTPSAWRV